MEAVGTQLDLPDNNKNVLNAKHEYLRKFHLLSSLSDEQIERVYKHSRTIHLTEGQPIFIQNDNVNNFYLVVTGRIKLFRVSPRGEEKIINIVSDGQFFAEALMFMDQPHYPVSATAIAQSEIISIDAKDFKVMLRDSVDTCFLMLSDISSRLQTLIHEIDTLCLQSGSCRVAMYILSKMSDEHNVFTLDVAKNVIAARLSIKPETLSRILKDLSARKILSVEGNELTIHDREALHTLCIGSD